MGAGSFRFIVWGMKLRAFAAAAVAMTALSLSASPFATAQSSDAASASSHLSSMLPELLPAPTGHTTTTRTLASGREFLLSVPHNYNPATAYPVVLVFGGWQHTAGGTRDYAQVEQVARDAIVVYAQGVNNAWAGAPYAQTSLFDDISYTREVVDNVAASHTVDRQQVYATGLSNGGGMALALGCHAPDLVAGVAGVAGAYYNPTVSNCAAGVVPTMIIHGTADDVVAYEGGVRHGAPYLSVDQVTTTMGRKNQCVLPNTRVTETGDTTVFELEKCKAGTRVVRVNGGGHTWFISPSATQLSVDFFRAQ
ncbi:Alpha/beta hydrolase family protein [Corynebacterium cystitidis DSM 20524]|uniref:Polyhydroxybutyrate depolymerase n=2 Tax=Corynebacterium cystitidis TaxID=35757 RepID=A0A1H9ST79_9CORY|nr:Alpha/beta hydrolase family protein [Corynebacterium cystitidis DSM 20524]SER88210.1 polyhydroxybutyrate depolymerase [Corynebacterium cystitidis DSM 20524]SNV67175.1 putative polyhydroxybutyrate depolymerase [Corynebacterium cystitidis]